MRIRSFKFVLASVIAAVAVLFFIIRNVEKDEGVTYCSSTGVKSYTLKSKHPKFAVLILHKKALI